MKEMKWNGINWMKESLKLKPHSSKRKKSFFTFVPNSNTFDLRVTYLSSLSIPKHLAGNLSQVVTSCSQMQKSRNFQKVFPYLFFLTCNWQRQASMHPTPLTVRSLRNKYANGSFHGVWRNSDHLKTEKCGRKCIQKSRFLPTQCPVWVTAILSQP